MCAPTRIALGTITEDPKSEWAKKFDNYTTNLASTLKSKVGGDLGKKAEVFAIYKVCSEILQKHGFDLNQYNTSNDAKDVVSLTDALGYKNVNLYGISYGTYLAMRVMRDFPQRLRSVVLDSTISPNVNKYESVVEDYEVPLLNLLEDC